jgi:hypothetical protein
MAAKRSKVLDYTPLLLDPKYPDVVKRYAMDLPRFAMEVCSLVPTWQQLELFESVQNPGSRTSVSSGHGTGKTQALAVIVLWHLICYAYSNTILSGPKLDIVQSGVRKYVADMWTQIEAGPMSWLAPHIKVEHKSIYIRGYKSQWWCQAKTAPAGKPESLAGEHRKFLLWLVDEASGVPDANFGVILGSLTEEWNRIAIASQPTRPTGIFYDTHHKLSKSRGGPWTNLTFSSEESPLVSDQFIFEKINQYGGRHDPLYQIKVLGLFPENLAGQLLSRSALEATIGAERCIPAGAEWGWAVLVDIGAGEYRDKSVVAVCQVFGHGQSHEVDARRVHVVSIPICDNTISPTALTARVMQIAGQLSNAVVLLDGGGLGLGVVKRLEELGVPNIVKVLWGKPCFKKVLKESYFNQRAHAMVAIAHAAKAGQLTIAADAIDDSRVVTELLDQGSRIPYHFNDKAQYVIESKRSKEWEGLPSPDIWDSLSFAFLEDCSYLMSEGEVTPGDVASVREKTVADLEAMLDAALA